MLAVLAVVSACRVDTTVAVVVRPDGSGAVTVQAVLDREATERLGADPAAALRLDDLRAAGWRVQGPTVADGALRVTLTKSFAAADRLGPVMAELGGAEGPFADWRLTTDNAVTSSSYQLTGTVRLTGSLDQFSDAEVAAALDGFATGRSPEELSNELKAGALRLTVSADLPGEIDEATGLTRDGEAAPSWSTELGTGSPVTREVTVTTSATDRSSVLFGLIGVVLVVAAVVLFVAGRRAGARRRRAVPPA